MSSQPTNFGLLPPELSDPKKSPITILPVPFERTTSYGKGTSAGPAAILRASQSMELWDEELGRETAEIGIATAAAVPSRAVRHGARRWPSSRPSAIAS